LAFRRHEFRGLRDRAARLLGVSSKAPISRIKGTWLMLGTTPLKFGYLMDPLSATLLFMVTIVGTLIQIYAMGYMHGDPRYSRFFAYVSLFMSAMLTLVISDNYLLFFMAWEIMGLCSYLLIGFYFEKDSAANASQESLPHHARSATSVSSRFPDAFHRDRHAELRANEHDHDGSTRRPHDFEYRVLAMAALLIFCGTIGKSAQFPLHVWLPDAMEGPTPGQRFDPCRDHGGGRRFPRRAFFHPFHGRPEHPAVVTTIGTITAFMAAFIALTQNDIKRILAYSTISQLGYMVTAMGLSGLGAGTFISSRTLSSRPCFSSARAA
jgi:NADH-quinone oxidoreductase subunit L